MEAKRRVEKIRHAPRRTSRGLRRDERRVLRGAARQLKATLRAVAGVTRGARRALRAQDRTGLGEANRQESAPEQGEARRWTS